MPVATQMIKNEWDIDPSRLYPSWLVRLKRTAPWGRIWLRANEMWGMLNFDRGDRDGVGYTVVKGLGSGEQAAAGWIWATHENRAARARFWLTKHKGWLGCVRVDVLG